MKRAEQSEKRRTLYHTNHTRNHVVSMLRLNFAYARLSHPINGSPVEFVRLTQRRTPLPQPHEIGRALDAWLTNRSANAPLAVPNPADEGEVRIAPLRLGLMDEIGVLVSFNAPCQGWAILP